MRPHIRNRAELARTKKLEDPGLSLEGAAQRINGQIVGLELAAARGDQRKAKELAALLEELDLAPGAELKKSDINYAYSKVAEIEEWEAWSSLGSGNLSVQAREDEMVL